MAVTVELIDGTFELFRQHFGQPARPAPEGPELGGLHGVVSSLVAMLGQGVTHLGVATDHVIESFRNDLWPGYKTSAGMPPELLSQFEPLEEAIAALGVGLWPMVELEADDALASAAAVADDDAAVGQVRIWTPDKDLGQCVRDGRVVQVDRRRKDAAGAPTVVDAAGVKAKFGVLPESIPDYLALVGDSADGFPGLPRWGAKSAAAVLARYVHLEDIPEHHWQWDLDVRGATALAATLADQREAALLFRHLATLVVDRSLL
ncbi:MAG TPA: 5'-3' exonuclease H3TH domain-containing protein, partial [Acidimicrobiales bacterium]